MPSADFITVMAVDKEALPDNEWIPAAIGEKVFFQLQIFLLMDAARP